MKFTPLSINLSAKAIVALPEPPLTSPQPGSLPQPTPSTPNLPTPQPPTLPAPQAPKSPVEIKLIDLYQFNLTRVRFPTPWA